jgi:hypothetical protein
MRSVGGGRANLGERVIHVVAYCRDRAHVQRPVAEHLRAAVTKRIASASEERHAVAD